MSLNDFQKRAKLDIKISISGSGAFSPLSYMYGTPADWTLTGEIETITFEDDLTIKEQTCGPENGTAHQFMHFNGGGSTGNTSGTIPVGINPNQRLGRESYGSGDNNNLGEWDVNTKPVLSSDGKADGAESPLGFYTVKLPNGTTVDDPITLNPAIDGITRVYPGDEIFAAGSTGNRRWYYGGQLRYPKTDRTFFWTPNTNPVLKSGGLVNGVLAKPGTVMLPTANFYIEDPEDAVDGYRYAYNGQGWMYDGRRWNKLLFDPLVYEPENGAKEFRTINVSFVAELIRQGYIYPLLLETMQQNKCFVVSNQTIDDDKPCKFTQTVKDEDPLELDLKFRWGSPLFGCDANIQPSVLVLHDFEDAWSYYAKKNQDWLRPRFKNFYSAVCILGDGELALGVDEFIDGNVTEIKETVPDPSGGELENTFTITLEIKTSLQ
jgi:hypothetical protein